MANQLNPEQTPGAAIPGKMDAKFLCTWIVHLMIPGGQRHGQRIKTGFNRFLVPQTGS